MFTTVKTLAYATRFDLGNANRAIAAYQRRTGGETWATQQVGELYVITNGSAFLRAMG